MADLELPPDFEKLVADYLRGHEALVEFDDAPIRVVSKPPDEDGRDTPWVQYRNLDDRTDDQDPADHLHGVLMQFDCYAGKGDGHDEGGGRPEATRLGRTVRVLLLAIRTHVAAGVVFTGCRITGDSRQPDSSPPFKPARERQVITAIVYGHGT